MTYRYANAVIVVFCKAPVPGQVKTRLMTKLSADEAAEIHIELSIRTLQLATKLQLCPVELWCAPTHEHSFFTTVAESYSISLHQQYGADIGEKMRNAMASVLDRYTAAVLIGCDCPSMTENDLEQALTALDRPNSCVLAPAEDGGYVLIGLNQPQSRVFDNIAWGTELVYAQTRARIDQLNLNFVELKQQWDLDTPEDLLRYRSGSVEQQLTRVTTVEGVNEA
ncbi:MAG: glycosyltransferase [Methylococcaceae bacterium]|nr:glycosyltransferase [Methylococcaceae bacterium]